MKVFIWMCSLRTEYCVFAKTVKEAKKKMKKLFPKATEMEQILTQVPQIKDVPDLVLTQSYDTFYYLMCPSCKKLIVGTIYNRCECI